MHSQTDVRHKQVVFPLERKSATLHYLPCRKVEGLAELEFSDYGRDPRFPAGWWILPTLLVGALFMIGIASLWV